VFLPSPARNDHVSRARKRERSGRSRASADVGGDGADALCRAIGAADYHLLSVQCFALAIKLLHRTVVHASKLGRPPAADPQPRYAD